MPGHPLRQAVVEVQRLVEPIGEERDDRDSVQPDRVDVVGSVDQQAALDHDRQDRHIGPMEGPGRERVLTLKTSHRVALSAINYADSNAETLFTDACRSASRR